VAVQPVAASPAADAAPQPVATQLTQHIAVLRGGPDGNHTMTVVLTPENLGPVQVQVTLDRGTVDLQLRGAHESGRAALMAALPDLRRDLESAGLQCSRLDVDRDTGGSWSAPQDRPTPGDGQTSQQSQPGRDDSRPRPWVRPADLGEGRPALTSTSPASSALDVRV
jgi:flagellar hook-length control protein FliK